MAKILSIDGNLTPHKMKEKLKKEYAIHCKFNNLKTFSDRATRDKITRLPSGTPNLLLFNNNCN